MQIFSDFSITDGRLVANETGARIPLDMGFARDAYRIAAFVGKVQALRATRALKGREPRATISFYPRKPRAYYAIWPACQLADVKIVDDHTEADLHFFFEDREFRTAPLAPPSNKPALNGGCFDIRKSVVERVFEETFGYPLAIDPTTHRGPAVEKSERNGKHDGRIVECPIAAPTPGCVYQRLIDNTFDGKEHVDIRTPVVGGKIPFVYLKRRTQAARFSNDNHRVDLAPVGVLLSADEQAKVATFARAMRLDFGGLDILRCRADGRIYIVDVNKTDMGPPSVLAPRQKLEAMRGLADALGNLVDARRPA
jgi:hypothetical protein